MENSHTQKTHRQSKWMKKVFQTNRNESKKLEVTIFTSDKMNFKTKAIYNETKDPANLKTPKTRIQKTHACLCLWQHYLCNQAMEAPN